MTQVLKSFDEYYTSSFDCSYKTVHADMFCGIKEQKRWEKDRRCEYYHKVKESNDVNDGVPNVLPERSDIC